MPKGREMTVDTIINEAIRELNISDEPDLYHLVRRWMRKNIKRETVSPIDTFNWPKGCLLVGLMHQAIKLSHANNSHDRALSLVAMASVKDYVDAWIKKGSPTYFVDDCLAGQALLLLIKEYREYSKNDENDIIKRDCAAMEKAAKKVMDFLSNHDRDAEGSLPYRPNQKTYQIVADGMGMAMPYMYMYGVLFNDDDAIQLGQDQLRAFMAHAIDKESGLPWHAYKINAMDESFMGNENNTQNITTYGSIGWGRAVGWLMYGVQASIEAFEMVESGMLSFTALVAIKELKAAKERLIQAVSKYRRESGLFGSQLPDKDSPIDTSATAMILYCCRDGLECNGNSNSVEHNCLKEYITDDGRVMQAQSECMGLGVYGEKYDSYPWSVGMALLLI